MPSNLVYTRNLSVSGAEKERGARMPTTPHVYKVFLTGPSDALRDIELIKQVLEYCNDIVAHVSVRFQAFHWIDDATPGAGTSAQERINQQADGYDIIVAVFVGKLGTPTTSHLSGTVEEIERALANKSRLFFGDSSVIVLFKTVSIDAMTGDLDGAVALKKYRNSLSDRGVLYRAYSDDDDIRSILFKSWGCF